MNGIRPNLIRDLWVDRDVEGTFERVIDEQSIDAHPRIAEVRQSTGLLTPRWRVPFWFGDLIDHVTKYLKDYVRMLGAEWVGCEWEAIHILEIVFRSHRAVVFASTWELAYYGCESNDPVLYAREKIFHLLQDAIFKSRMNRNLRLGVFKP
jgi:hypothetical protein